MNVQGRGIRIAVFLLIGGSALAAGCKAADTTPQPVPQPPQPQVCTPGCATNILTYCDSSGVAQTENCRATLDVAGNPTTCQFVDDDYYCVGNFSGGCGEETIDGRCDGAKVVRCTSIETGDADTSPRNVEIIDCAKDPGGNTTCAVAPDGLAGCAKPSTKGCGAVPASGSCSGTVLSRCVNSTVQTTDCQTSNQRCGLLADDSGYACINAAVFKTAAGDPTLEVKGTIVYEKRTVDTSSYDNARKGFAATPTLTPVRRAQVQIVSDTGAELQRAFTDETGAFTLYLPTQTTRARVIVSASADPERYPLVVRDCPPGPTDQLPAGCTDKVGSAHQWMSAYFTGPTALGQVVITESSGLGGAFNIFDLMLKGQDFARVNLNQGQFPSTPPVAVQWRKGYETQTSYYNGSQIVIQGVVTDTDEYDDPVLEHEFGHFLERAFSVSDSPGGSHNGSPTDPRLAFGEGYGTYVGCRISGSSLYFDSSASGISVTNINATGFKASLSSPKGISQLLSEYVVAEVLWRLDLGTGGDTVGSGGTDPLGSTPIFDVLGKYFKGNQKFNANHGPNGRELTKFIDGMFCRNYSSKADGNTPIIKKVVTTDHDFPYDDYDHNIAKVGSCTP